MVKYGVLILSDEEHAGISTPTAYIQHFIGGPIANLIGQQKEIKNIQIGKEVERDNIIIFVENSKESTKSKHNLLE